MADITLPTFTAGTVADSAAVMAAFYEDALASIGSSLSTINGALDENNLDPTLIITADTTQKGSFVDIGGASGTANLDYRPSWFGAMPWELISRTFSHSDQIQSIPGACRSEYFKWPAKAYIMWTVFWEYANVNDDDKRALVQLYIDGVAQDAQFRLAGRIGLTGLTPQGYLKSRMWTGHMLVDIDQGWHDIGLKIQTSAGYTTRVHACSIDILHLKYGTAS